MVLSHEARINVKAMMPAYPESSDCHVDPRNAHCPEQTDVPPADQATMAIDAGLSSVAGDDRCNQAISD